MLRGTNREIAVSQTRFAGTRTVWPRQREVPVVSRPQRDSACEVGWPTRVHRKGADVFANATAAGYYFTE